MLGGFLVGQAAEYSSARSDDKLIDLVQRYVNSDPEAIRQLATSTRRASNAVQLLHFEIRATLPLLLSYDIVGHSDQRWDTIQQALFDRLATNAAPASLMQQFAMT